MTSPSQQTLRAIASITAIAVGAAVLVTGSYEVSHARIEENRRARLLRTLHEVLDPARHDNALTESRRAVRDVALLGSTDPVDVFIATREGRPVAALFSSVAPRGYSGPIHLLIGIADDGTVTGVRVTSHRETPGLGDVIEIEKSDWILGFDGTSLSSPPLDGWAVSRDQGLFDAITGATITPRAVVDGVKNTLLYFQQHKDELFSEVSGSDPSSGAQQ
ncbi:MAG: electron transport complex subunit RsxG [Gammaproteobacteria bacterium]